MNRVRVGETVWLSRAPVERPLSQARLRRGALVRGLGLAGAAAVLGAVALTFLPPADPAVAAPAAPAPVVPKVGVRLATWNGPVAAAGAPAPELNTGNLFEARPFTAAPARLQAGPSPAGPPLAFAPAAPGNGWRETEHPRVEAVDGRTLDAGSLRIVIGGIGLPDPGQMCRTLDGRIEPCAARARTQLELLTRSRTVSCRTRDLSPGVAEGSCRIGSSDLAERLVKTGFVHRRSDEGQAVASMDVREP